MEPLCLRITNLLFRSQLLVRATEINTLLKYLWQGLFKILIEIGLCKVFSIIWAAFDDNWATIDILWAIFNSQFWVTVVENKKVIGLVLQVWSVLIGGLCLALGKLGQKCDLT